MNYDGPFTFINSDANDARKPRGQNFAVLSHVVGKHRKWTKGKKLELLKSAAIPGRSDRLVRCTCLTVYVVADTTGRRLPDTKKDRNYPPSAFRRMVS